MKCIKRIKTKNVNKYGIDKATERLEYAQSKHLVLKNKVRNLLTILLPLC